jgi:CBS domain-containing protein
MKNSIADRVVYFLSGYPPFNMLNEKSLHKIAAQVQIIYLEKGDAVFEKGDAYHDDFYIVRDGAIYLYHTNENDKNIIGINDTGDIFGLRALITKENYKLSAVANEESIVYAIPIEVFESVTNNIVKINKYLITSFASNAYDPYTAEEYNEIFVDYIPNKSSDIANFQTAHFTTKPITCKPSKTLQYAANKMCKHDISCIIVVDENKHPIGIISNNDIKNKIATGLYPITTKVSNIMSAPVITDKENITVANAQLKMIQHSVSHICITKDGTPNSKLTGILTHHDILVTQGNNPSVILKDVRRAKRTRYLRTARLKANTLLKSYLEQNIPLTHILKVISSINDAVTERAIYLSIKKMKTPPPVAFSWISIGSQGRQEQLLFTDQDNALIFEDVPKHNYNTVKTYFIELSKHVTKTLNIIGFEYCKADMMASNPEWCKSISEWKTQFSNWILNPDEKSILLSSIFFDYNHIYGDKTLVDRLTDNIFETVGDSSRFYSILANDAMKSPPPLGFFKQFLVEQNGEHKDLFNIKSRALMPLIDAARVLVLSKKIKNVNSTYQRFEKLAELEENNKELFLSCSYAFKALLKFKTKQGILHENSGKFIELSTLTKEEQLKLKRCFKPIKEIQESLKLRFNTSNSIL